MVRSKERMRVNVWYKKQERRGMSDVCEEGICKEREIERRKWGKSGKDRMLKQERRLNCRGELSRVKVVNWAEGKR